MLARTLSEHKNYQTEDEHVPLSVKLLIVGFVVLVIGIYMVQEDLRLSYFGLTTDAEVMDDYETSSSMSVSRGARIPRMREVDGKYHVLYRFKDDKGELVTGGGKLPLDYAGSTPSNGTVPGAPKFLTVKVRYIAGKSSVNRLEAASTTKSYNALYIGVAMLLAGAVLSKFESGANVRRRVAEHQEREQNRPVIAEEPRRKSETKTLEF